MGVEFFRVAEFDLKLCNFFGEHINFFVGLFVLAVHDHLLSVSFLDVVADLLVGDPQLFDSLQDEELEVLLYVGDIGHLSLEGVDFVLEGVDLPLETVVLCLLLVVALDVPSHFPAVLVVFLSFESLDGFLHFCYSLVLVPEHTFEVITLLFQLGRDYSKFCLSFEHKVPA